jgi:hypothetical protein
MQEENRLMREQLAEMRGAVEAMRSMPPTQVVTAGPAVAEPFISDEEIDEAVSEGKGAGTKFRQLVNQAVGRAVAQVKETEIDPLRAAGLGSLKELAENSIKGEEYYTDYKREIDSVAAQVPAENLSNPQTWKLIYQNVVGSHTKEIAAKEVEAALRKQRTDVADPSLPGVTGQNRQVETGPTAPKVRDYAGVEAENALRYKGANEDEMVKRMNIPGVTTWAEYVAMGERLEAENG